MMLLQKYSGKLTHEGCKPKLRLELGFGLMYVDILIFHLMLNLLTVRRVGT
jgi:hypothetical protein